MGRLRRAGPLGAKGRPRWQGARRWGRALEAGAG
ncbi:hypothetical protein GA0115259_1003618, partial [Streptomyces sp. MnatMP-M17]